MPMLALEQSTLNRLLIYCKQKLNYFSRVHVCLYISVLLSILTICKTKSPKIKITPENNNLENLELFLICTFIFKIIILGWVITYLHFLHSERKTSTSQQGNKVESEKTKYNAFLLEVRYRELSPQVIIRHSLYITLCSTFLRSSELSLLILVTWPLGIFVSVIWTAPYRVSYLNKALRILAQNGP